MSPGFPPPQSPMGVADNATGVSGQKQHSELAGRVGALQAKTEDIKVPDHLPDAQERYGPAPRKEESGRNWAEDPGLHPPGQKFRAGFLFWKNRSEPEAPLTGNSGSIVG